MRLQPPSLRGGRRGALLLELLLALALGAVVLGAFAAALVSSLRWARALTDRAEALEVARTAWVVLDEELRPGLPDRDWWVEDGAVRLRAFRGLARVCGEEGAGRLVAYRGRRRPDPDRDSLLVLGTDGGWRTSDLDASQEVSASDPACVPTEDERLFEWGWEAGAPEPVLLRLFETGEYHLADGALRYRRGEGGRQPLTPERLGPGSGFSSEGGDVEVRLSFPDGPMGEGPGAFVWRVRSAEPDP